MSSEDRAPGHLASATIAEPLAPAPVVLDPTRPTPGLARPVPLRREGPAKLTGQAIYVDDLAMPGAWFGATIRST
jgi:hypothetical protein